MYQWEVTQGQLNGVVTSPYQLLPQYTFNKSELLSLLIITLVWHPHACVSNCMALSWDNVSMHVLSVQGTGLPFQSCCQISKVRQVPHSQSSSIRHKLINAKEKLKNITFFKMDRILTVLFRITSYSFGDLSGTSQFQRFLTCNPELKYEFTDSSAKDNTSHLLNAICTEGANGKKKYIYIFGRKVLIRS